MNKEVELLVVMNEIDKLLQSTNPESQECTLQSKA